MQEPHEGNVGTQNPRTRSNVRSVTGTSEWNLPSDSTDDELETDEAIDDETAHGQTEARRFVEESAAPPQVKRPRLVGKAVLFGTGIFFMIMGFLALALFSIILGGALVFVGFIFAAPAYLLLRKPASAPQPVDTSFDETSN